MIGYAGSYDGSCRKEDAGSEYLVVMRGLDNDVQCVVKVIDS